MRIDQLKNEIREEIRQLLPMNNFENNFDIVLDTFNAGKYGECINQLAYYAKVYQMGEKNCYYILSIIAHVSELIDD